MLFAKSSQWRIIAPQRDRLHAASNFHAISRRAFSTFVLSNPLLCTQERQKWIFKMCFVSTTPFISSSNSLFMKWIKDFASSFAPGVGSRPNHKPSLRNHSHLSLHFVFHKFVAFLLANNWIICCVCCCCAWLRNWNSKKAIRMSQQPATKAVRKKSINSVWFWGSWLDSRVHTTFFFVFYRTFPMRAWSGRVEIEDIALPSTRLAVIMKYCVVSER